MLPLVRCFVAFTLAALFAGTSRVFSPASAARAAVAAAFATLATRGACGAQ